MLAIGAHGSGIRHRADQEDLFGTMSPEWSKAWAVSEVSPWTDEVVLERVRERVDLGVLLY